MNIIMNEETVPNSMKKSVGSNRTKYLRVKFKKTRTPGYTRKHNGLAPLVVGSQDGFDPYHGPPRCVLIIVI